jgi:cytoskeleton protein RodZ
MNEGAAAPVGGAPTAGRLLREARERQGLHIVALAAMIKVTPKKLEALEADRLDALPDATFARALAQTICRALKIDPVPVLALLPVAGHRLEQAGRTLNTPFKDRPGALVQRDGSGFASSPAFWVTGLILLAAVTVYLLPAGLVGLGGRSASGAASGAAPRPAELPGMPPETAASETSSTTIVPDSSVAPASGAAPLPSSSTGPAAPATPTAAVSTAAALSGILQVHVSADSWVEVNDARGQALIARLLTAGESVGLDGAPPLRLRIGNAARTRVVFRGQPAELAAFTRDNVARLELK